MAPRISLQKLSGPNLFFYESVPNEDEKLLLE